MRVVWLVVLVCAADGAGPQAVLTPVQEHVVSPISCTRVCAGIWVRANKQIWFCKICVEIPNVEWWHSVTCRAKSLTRARAYGRTHIN